MMTWGRGGVSIPPKSDDVIYEQPLTLRKLLGNLVCPYYNEGLGGLLGFQGLQGHKGPKIKKPLMAISVIKVIQNFHE